MTRKSLKSRTSPDRLRPFSYPWLLISMGTFIGAELVLGGLIGRYIVGRYVSISLGFTLQGLLNLASYFIGGMAIGLFSPGIRVLEPAIGAFMSVALMMVLTIFTPYSFMNISTSKLFIGGIIAFFLAFAGARLGERMAGNRV